MEDREWVSRLLAGDDEAQRLFHDQFRPRLHRTCVHFLGYQDSECEDLVQETFLLALKNLENFGFKGGFYGWVHKICVNLCFQRLRQRQRLVVAEAEALEAASESIAAQRHAEAERDSLKHEALALVRRVFERLELKCRRVIQLRDFEGRAYMDIARTLKLAPGTLFSRLARCREALKRLVKAEEAPGGRHG